MKHVFTAYDGKLIPATDEAESWIRRIKPGDIIDVDVVRPRSQQHHKLFFSMLKIVSDNLDNCSVDNLLDIIKLGTGHTKIVKLPGGVAYAIPKSISFSAMDRDTFSAFFTKAVDYIISYVLPGIDKDALTYEIYSLAGVPMALMDS